MITTMMPTMVKEFLSFDFGVGLSPLTADPKLAAEGHAS